MKDAREAAARRPLLYDGSKGVMLQRLGLAGGEASELWNVTHPRQVQEVHAEYAAAGADILQTNTFPGNRITLRRHGLVDRFEELNAAGVRLARAAAGPEQWVAASVGPTGELLEPAGELSFDEAYSLYAEQAAVLAGAGADLIHLETFGDLAELRAAILAVKERTGLPVIATATFEGGGRTFSGNSPEACAVVCEALGVAFVGANCSTGAEGMVPVVAAMARVTAGPLVAKPNAGLPEVVGGQVVYRETAEHFAAFTGDFVAAGARLIGGCCGTTPVFIREMKRRLDAAEAKPRPAARRRLLASAFQVEEVGPELVIGEIGSDETADGDGAALADRANELARAGARCVLIDFGPHADRWDPQALAGDLSLFVRVPLVVGASRRDFLDRLLRLYPGRAGVAGEPARGALGIAQSVLASCRRVGR